MSDPEELLAVRREAESASRRGVRGVPHFVFGDALTVSGAQSEEALVAAIERAARSER